MKLIEALFKAVVTIWLAVCLLLLADRLNECGWLVVTMLLATAMLMFIFYEKENL